MRKILSYLVLLMLFATNGHAYISLTPDLYIGDCAYNLGTELTAGGTAYGDPQVNEDYGVDLDGYKTLRITVGQSGEWRAVFNTKGTDQTGKTFFQIIGGNNGDHQLNMDYCQWEEAGDGKYVMIIDLNRIRQTHGKAVLNCIKNNYGASNLTVYAIELEPYSSTATTGSAMFQYDIVNNSNVTMPEVTDPNNANDQKSSTVSPITMTVYNGNLPEGGVAYTSIDGQNRGLRFRPGTSFKIECPEGYKITGITYNLNGSGNRNFVCSTGSITGNYTWTPSNDVTTSVTFSNNGTSNSQNLYTSEINVSYEKLAVELEPEKTFIAWRPNGSTQYPDLTGIPVGEGEILLENVVVRLIENITNMVIFTGNDLEILSCDNGTARINSPNGSKYANLYVTPDHAGYINVTIRFKGKEQYKASETTLVLKTAGTETVLGLHQSQGSKLEYYVDEGQGRQFLRLYTVNGGLLTFDTSKTWTVTTEDDDIINIDKHNVSWNGNIPGLDGSRYDTYITPKKDGVATVHVEYPGDDVNYACSYDFTVVVKKHAAKVSFAENPKNVTYSYNGTTTPQTAIKWMDEDGTTPTFSIVYSSDDPDIATVNASTGEITMKNAGTCNITATVVTTVDGKEIYSSSSASYQLVLQGNEVVRIVWVNGINWGDNAPTSEKEGYGNRVNKMAGTYYGRKYYESENPTRTYYPNTDDEYTESIKRIENIEGPYGQDVQFQALPIKANATLPSNWKLAHYDCGRNQFYYIDNSRNSIQFSDNVYERPENLSPKYYDGSVPGAYDIIYKPAQGHWQDLIQYSVSNSNLTTTMTTPPHGNTWGGGYKYFQVNCSTYSPDSIIVTAKIPGNGSVMGARSDTKFYLAQGYFNFSFDPKAGVVNEGRWIIPYVNFPDIPMEDFDLIWAEVTNSGGVNVVDMDKLFVNNSSNYLDPTNPDKDEFKELSTAEINEIAGSYIEWKWHEVKQKRPVDGEEVDVVVDRYPVITGIKPQIFGIKAGEEADVILHITSGKWADTQAKYHVTVLSQDDVLFTWEPNAIIEEVNGKKVLREEDEIKTINMFEGDFIHVPGIVGNANGNDEYSRQGSYKYLYAIKGDASHDRRIILNRDAYFYGEGVPNYFITSGPTDYTPILPENNSLASDAPSALIFKEVGLGNHYRYDSLLVYANKPGDVYLFAEDAQSGYRCKPIHIHVIPFEGEGTDSEGFKSLQQQKREAMAGMSYPFTWDFEHMNIEHIQLDAGFVQEDREHGYVYDGNDTQNGLNVSAYWRKRWDNTERGAKRNLPPQYKEYYQWNGAFNADHDDKNGNGTVSPDVIIDNVKTSSGLRQRWFKDLTANGEYLNLFKGLMINIAGLDYWQQKYTRFNVSQEGTSIMFEGGPHFMSMPGFGIVGNVGEEYTTVDNTRPVGSVRMPALHNQINSIDNHITPADFVSTYNTGVSYDATAWAKAHKNEKVRFVIRAKGSANADQLNQYGHYPCVIYLGGKSMLLTEVGENGVRFSSHDDVPGTQRIDLSSTEKTYVLDINPWDEDLQEQIYLCMDGGVTIYWMGISTEPRDMRLDYESATYSYPKDIDMLKTNEVMGIVTERENGEKVQFKALYAKGYSRGDNELLVEQVPNYKFGANEGVLIYPDKSFDEALNPSRHYSIDKTTLEKRTVKNKTVVYVVMDENDPTKAKVDAKGNYVYASKTYDYDYYYLPTYFIANAENQDNYERNLPSVQDNVPRGREVDMNPNYLTQNGDKAFKTSDSGVRYNNLPNKLSQSVYSSYIPLDFYADNAGVPSDYVSDGATLSDGDDNYTKVGNTSEARWIPLGLTNEFIARYVGNDSEGTNKALTGYLENIDGTSFNMYYDLIGPKVVRFYRNFTAGRMKGRRSYLKLTWQEYAVNTNGKSGVSNGYEEEFPYSDPEKPVSNHPTHDGVGNPDVTDQMPVKGKPVQIVFAYSNSQDNENMVSEDGGFPDGIEEVMQSESNGDFYNLNGIKVATPTKGVYILNGRKVVVK